MLISIVMTTPSLAVVVEDVEAGEDKCVLEQLPADLQQFEVLLTQIHEFLEVGKEQQSPGWVPKVCAFAAGIGFSTGFSATMMAIYVFAKEMCTCHFRAIGCPIRIENDYRCDPLQCSILFATVIVALMVSDCFCQFCGVVTSNPLPFCLPNLPRLRIMPAAFPVRLGDFLGYASYHVAEQCCDSMLMAGREVLNHGRQVRLDALFAEVLWQLKKVNKIENESLLKDLFLSSLSTQDPDLVKELISHFEQLKGVKTEEAFQTLLFGLTPGTCDICFEKRTLTEQLIFKCGHSLCKSCHSEDIKRSVQCPYCRAFTLSEPCFSVKELLDVAEPACE